MAPGMARAGETRPVLATIGDSTFLHAGLPALIDAVYNDANITVLLLDNQHHGDDRWPGPRRHRPHAARRACAAGRLRSAGARRRRHVGAQGRLATTSRVVHQTLREAIAHRGVSVVISDRPCVIDPVRIKGPALQVMEPQCNACQSCMNLGCPALTWARRPSKAATR